MSKDHKIILQFDQANCLILHTLIDQHKKYIDFHNRRHKCEDPECRITNSDLLICDMIKFVDMKESDTDVVDILIQVAADAFNLNIHVYQNNHGTTQLLTYMGGNCSHDIFMKFSHDPLFSGFNHYEPIVKVQIKEDEDSVKHEVSNNEQEHGIILDDIVPDIR